MIVLTSTEKLQLVLSAGTADVDANYNDRTATAYGSSDSQQTAATAATNDICTAPAASTSREINGLSAYVKTTGGTLTIQKLNSTGPVTTILWKGTLLVGETLTYTHAFGPKGITASFGIKQGGVSGPASSTDNAFVRWDGTTGTIIQDSSATLDDSGRPTFPTTIGVGAATPSTSGAGVTFPATQSASTDANTLDDYEEGAWTPADASGAGLSLTVVANGCYYTKIGRLVFVSADFTFPITVDATNAKIGGLPFTAKTSTNDTGGSVFMWSTQGAFISASVIQNTTTFNMRQGNGNALTNVAFSAALFRGHFVYTAAP